VDHATEIRKLMEECSRIVKASINRSRRKIIIAPCNYHAKEKKR